MNNNVWQIVGVVGVIGFCVAVALSLVARRLFVSDREEEVNLGDKIISAVGGARNARIATAERARRKK